MPLPRFLSWRWPAGVILALGLLLGARAAEPMDRAQLRGIVDAYLSALVAHDPSRLPLARDVKFTENTARISVGDGLWVNAAEGPTAFKVYALDPAAGQAAFLGVFRELGDPVILALRLKVAAGEITEIEHVVARRLGEKPLPGLAAPRSGLVTAVPAAERSTREEMLRIADSYFESIEHNDDSRAPFAEDCERHENGSQTTTKAAPNPADFGSGDAEQLRLAMARVDACGCAAQMSSHILEYITRIRPRRLLVVDEELGLVFAFPMFVHRGNVPSVRIRGVPGVDVIERKIPPFNLQAGEIFKIRGGRIHEIEANGVVLPYLSNSGWGD
jgi:hypothetical protein